MATLASRERSPYLLRAIDSILVQKGVKPRVLVVVNGGNAEPALVRRLEGLPDVLVLRRQEAGIPAALGVARRQVDSVAFSQLDDDDELLPGALALRLERLQAGDRPDAVVTNGAIRAGEAERFSIPHVETVARDPLAAMTTYNWLLPGSALFRTSSIDAGLFEHAPRYLEWTYVGLRLATRHRIAFLPQPTIVHYEDLPFSVDRSRAGVLGRPWAFRQLLTLDLPPNVRRALRAKRAAAWHDAAEHLLKEGDYRAAWHAHSRSLMHREFWRYLGFTRHLLHKRPVRAAADLR